MKQQVKESLIFLAIGAIIILFLAWIVNAAVPSNFLALKHKNHSAVTPLPDGIDPASIYIPCPKDFALGNNVHCLVYYMVRVYIVEIYASNRMVGFEAILLDVEDIAGGIKYYQTFLYSPWIKEIDEKEFWRILNDYIWLR